MDGVCGLCHGGPWDGFTVVDGVRVIQLKDGWYRWIEDRWRWRPIDDGETASVVPLRRQFNQEAVPEARKY